MSGMVKRELNAGNNIVGKETPDFKPAITVKGAGLAAQHCTIEYSPTEDKATLCPHAEFKNYTVKVNGELVTEPIDL